VGVSVICSLEWVSQLFVCSFIYVGVQLFLANVGVQLFVEPSNHLH